MRGKKNQQRVAELREAKTRGQKSHQENGELLKQADTPRTTISALSVEVEEREEKKREGRGEDKEYEEMRRESVGEEEKQKRKTLHDEIATLKRNQEMDRYAR
ncbi:hypothetical protein Dimus_020859 [Dionaea muscipula]